MDSSLQVFCLNNRAPKDCRKYLARELRTDDGQQLVDVKTAQQFLLQRFPLLHGWQQASYSIRPEEITALEASPSYTRLLLPFSLNMPHYLVLEDDTALLFRTDSSLQMLKDRLKMEAEVWRGLYLFLLESAALSCFLRITKSCFNDLSQGVNKMPSSSSFSISVT
jgi:hypothetical protein